MKIWIVDAFSSVPFNGNPAAVCLVDEFLPKEVMQKIASEMNFSETAFVKQIAKNHYHIRWFTPNSEAPLCGHATIAATHILFQESRQLESDTIIYKSLSGELIVTKTDGWINLNFPYYEVHAIPFNDEIKKIVNINPIFTGFSENCIFMEYNSPDQI
jgi:PhzF family phenazine biosynthesis protein